MILSRLKDIFLQAVHNVGSMITNRAQSVQHAGNVFLDSLYREGTILKRFTEGAKDIWAAIRNPDAMPAHQRHLDEFKLAVGGSAAAVGAVEVNPLFAAGGAIPAWEAVLDLEHAGHKWRRTHSL